MDIQNVTAVAPFSRKEPVNQQASQKVTTEESAKRAEKKEQITRDTIEPYLNDIVKETTLKYSIDEQNDHFIIKVMDKKTDKIIKEIPSHELQVLRKNFEEQIGVLFDELI